MNIEKRKIQTATFRKTEAWQTLRDAVIKRAGGRCECAGGYLTGGTPESTRCENGIDHIHHLVYPIIPAEIKTDDLLGLCQICHETRHEVNSVLEAPPCCRYVHRRSHR